MEDTSRNTNEIIMQVHNLFRFADPVFRLTAIGTIKLIQFFARMVREKKLSAIELEDFGEFLNLFFRIFLRPPRMRGERPGRVTVL